MLHNLIKILFYDPDQGWVEDEIEEEKLKVEDREPHEETRTSYLVE